MDAFVRCNLITRTQSNHFSATRCWIGYLISFSMLSISKTLMYALFIYRIHIIFKESHRHKKTKYNALYSLNILKCIIIHIGLILFFTHNKQRDNFWKLYHSKHSDNLIFCAFDFTHDSIDNLRIFTIVTAVMEFILIIALLFIMLFGLREINLSLLEQYIADQGKINDAGDANDEKREEVTASMSLELVVRRNSELGKDMVNDMELQRVIKMHNLFKKQTILVIIVIASNLLTWTMFIIRRKVGLIICWHIILNAICVWLMYSFSDKYWQCAKRYLCCRLCYFYDVNRYLQQQQ